MNIPKLNNKELFIEKLKESIDEVISMFLMTPVELIESNDVINTPFIGQKVTINISIMGELSGSILMTMDLKTAKKIAAIMTMKDEIEEFDTFHESALREMLNMISGTFASKIAKIENPLTKEVYDIDISSPISIISEDESSIWVEKGNVMKLIACQIEKVGMSKVYLTVKGI